MKGIANIKVMGHLDKSWMNTFQAEEINYTDICTNIRINIKDESHLHGILNLIRDLNLVLISVNSAEQA